MSTPDKTERYQPNLVSVEEVPSSDVFRCRFLKHTVIEGVGRYNKPWLP